MKKKNEYRELDYLLDNLVGLGFVTTEQVATTKKKASTSGVGVVELMLTDKILRPVDVTHAKAAHFGVEAVDLSAIQIKDAVIAAIPRHLARGYRVIPVDLHGNAITIAMADPNNIDTMDTLSHLLNRDIILQVTSDKDIKAALAKYYGSRRRKK